MLKSHLEATMLDILDAPGPKLILMDRPMHKLLDLAFPVAFFKQLEITSAMLLDQ